MKRYAIFSSTWDPMYCFYIPLVDFTWRKLGVSSICFVPEEENTFFPLIRKYAKWVSFPSFHAPKDKQATYAQLSRIYGGCLDLGNNAWVIISDVDMSVHSEELLTDASPHVWGTDLVPVGQLPVCYVSMSHKLWNILFDCGSKSYQEMLDADLGHIECLNFRGNYWSFEQEKLFKKLDGFDITRHERAIPGTQFASHRVDRDNQFWSENAVPGLIDAHLFRPGYTEENFAKILELFMTMYPEENFDWMIEYKNEFIKLI
jgi:hypothetical protein